MLVWVLPAALLFLFHVIAADMLKVKVYSLFTINVRSIGIINQDFVLPGSVILITETFKCLVSVIGSVGPC